MIQVSSLRKHTGTGGSRWNEGRGALNAFVLESDVLSVNADIAWNLQRDSDSLRLRTDGFGDWNFDQDGRTHV